MTDELLATSKSGPGQTALLIADCTKHRDKPGARVTSTADATPAHAIAISITQFEASASCSVHGGRYFPYWQLRPRRAFMLEDAELAASTSLTGYRPLPGPYTQRAIFKESPSWDLLSVSTTTPSSR